MNNVVFTDEKIRRSDFTCMSSDAKTTIHGVLWEPAHEGEIQCVVQLVHGMAEHILRYDPFARFLVQAGCVVVGHDHLGHGLSLPPDVDPAESLGDLPRGKGADILITDVQTVRCQTQERFPNIPYVIFGHSMGSFVVRSYLTRYGQGLAGAILCGTGWQPAPLLAMGKALTTILAQCKSNSWRSSLVDSLAAGGYSRAFDVPASEGLAWLSRDPAVWRAYHDDPACGQLFSVGAYHELFSLVGMSQNSKMACSIPHDLPIFIISGTHDPVGSMGKAIPRVVRFLRDHGVVDVEEHLYEGARHELLNEVNADEVMTDIRDWLLGKKLLHD